MKQERGICYRIGPLCRNGMEARDSVDEIAGRVLARLRGKQAELIEAVKIATNKASFKSHGNGRGRRIGVQETQEDEGSIGEIVPKRDEFTDEVIASDL